jgi:hypothetical protein
VFASFDRQYETLIVENSDAKTEICLVRTSLVKIWQLMQKSASLNGNDAIWMQLTDRADAEKSVQ